MLFGYVVLIEDVFFIEEKGGYIVVYGVIVLNFDLDIWVVYF